MMWLVICPTFYLIFQILEFLSAKMFWAFLKILGFFGNKIVNFWSIEKKVEGMTDHIIRYKKTPLRVISKPKPAGFLISDLFLIVIEQCEMLIFCDTDQDRWVENILWEFRKYFCGFNEFPEKQRNFSMAFPKHLYCNST